MVIRRFTPPKWQQRFESDKDKVSRLRVKLAALQASDSGDDRAIAVWLSQILDPE